MSSDLEKSRKTCENIIKKINNENPTIFREMQESSLDIRTVISVKFFLIF